MRTLIAYLNEQRVGTLSEGDGLWSFTYDDAWLQHPHSFDLSPRLVRSQRLHHDGGSDRPVQWYFDNLLPEEALRDALCKEAQVQGDDAFALLAYLGAESAGSLTLLPPGQLAQAPGGLRELADDALCQRIANLPRATLASGAPKRMSAAGAQNKLLVVYQAASKNAPAALFEPVGSQPSTHILKPNHRSGVYPSSVINEFAMMRLARKLKLDVPDVYRHYTPEPVYIMARFDRFIDAVGSTQRSHIIDACQLLNKSRTFKYQAASLETLAQTVLLCRNRAATRLKLYRWLIFNLLIANHDNHLKNLSFSVNHQGIALCPAYDLLSTAAYHTRAFANERANWPSVTMAIALPGAPTFAAVTRVSVLSAGAVLGLSKAISVRELNRMALALPGALQTLISTVEAENATYPDAVRPYLGGEMRLLRTIEQVVVPDMLKRVLHE